MEVDLCQTYAAVLSIFLPKCDQTVTPVSTEFSQFIPVSVEDASFAIGKKKKRLLQKFSPLMHIFRVIFQAFGKNKPGLPASMKQI